MASICQVWGKDFVQRQGLTRHIRSVHETGNYEENEEFSPRMRKVVSNLSCVVPNKINDKEVDGAELGISQVCER